jgi:DNA primase large subunit
MERRHAHYPFTRAARTAVEDAGVDLAELVAEDDPAVDRAVERVERSLVEGTVGDPRRVDRTELLSYPVARVLVSLLDEPTLVRRYAAAEAATAAERFRANVDADDLASTGGGVSLDWLLAEFDLDDAVREAGGEEPFRVAVGPYLRLAPDGEDWRLVARPLADGEVPVTREELFALLESAVRERVAADLPLGVPPAVAEPLADVVDDVAALLDERDLPPPEAVAAVERSQFPPCVAALYDRVAAGEDLPHHSRFALVTFLSAAGLDPDDVAAVFADAGPETARHQAERVGEGYAPPSCATMQALGDCVPEEERADRCATIDHPLNFYAGALADAGVDTN